jgi:hypothetical protein
MNEPGRLPYHSTHRGPQARRHLLSDGKQNFINIKETMSVTEHGGPPIATLRELAFKGDTDHEFARRPKEIPARSVAAPRLSDVRVYLWVVAFLGLTVLATVAGLIILAVTGKSPAPEGLLALGFGALGALGGLLAPSPASTSKMRG